MNNVKIGLVLLTLGFLSGCDQGRYEIAIGDAVTVYRLDKDTGEICQFFYTKEPEKRCAQ